MPPLRSGQQYTQDTGGLRLAFACSIRSVPGWRPSLERVADLPRDESGLRSQSGGRLTRFAPGETGARQREPTHQRLIQLRATARHPSTGDEVRCPTRETRTHGRPRCPCRDAVDTSRGWYRRSCSTLIGAQ